jgi:hypothetical protein
VQCPFRVLGEPRTPRHEATESDDQSLCARVRVRCVYLAGSATSLRSRAVSYPALDCTELGPVQATAGMHTASEK